MFDTFAVAPLNHLLRANTWARDALKPHAGKTASFRCLPFVTRLTVLESGEVAPAAADAEPAVTLTLTPGLMLRVAARDEAVWRDVIIDGDTAFATAIHHLWQHLRWDAEEDLSKVVGDVAAHRIAESGRSLQRWARAGSDNLAHSFAEYWTEERPLIATKQDIARFTAEVDQLRDDTARLEKRFDLLCLR
ncbi:MAG: SCP2 sterol-binding domain-containing protein [Burkholderiales bacterium]|jgi:ubiquinone biosynthesis protein UbiJ|nr:SCP2 sterol-binding domain-containing protein [Burkholderiales bacterium]